MIPRVVLRCVRLAARSAGNWRQASSANAASSFSENSLVDLEKRWKSMPPHEQAEIWMSLRDRMKSSWKEMSPLEKKMSYYVSFGPHGPRALTPPGEWKTVVWYTSVSLVISWAMFWARNIGAKPPPKTMTPEWQEMSNERMREQKIEPLTFIGNPEYNGKGMVQNSPAILG